MSEAPIKALPDTADDPHRRPSGVGWLAIGLACGAILSALLTVLLLGDEKSSTTSTAQGLAGLLIGGLLTFLFGLASVVATFRALNLSAPEEPLGLPSGSVQAFIALFLILLFFVMSVFLYLNISRTTASPVLTGLTAEQVADVPAEQIQVVIPVPIETPDPENPDGDPLVETRFNLIVSGPERSAVAEDIARQIVTTIGTLIVAIAAFYFGAKGIGNGTRQNEPIG